MKLSVLYLVDGRFVGGIATGLLGLLGSLEQAGIRARLVVSHNGPAATVFRSHRIRCQILPTTKRLEFLREFIHRHRIQIVQSCDAVSEGALAARQAQIPHVWYVGGAVEATYLGPSARALEIFRDLMEPLSQAIVVPTQILGREQFPHLMKSICHVIPWGVELPPAQYIRIRPRISGTPVVAMAGNFYPAKRHIDFVRTAYLLHRSNPKIRFCIAGRCVGGSSSARQASRRYRKQIQKSLHRLGIETSTQITSFLPETRWGWYQKIDLLLCPSHEGMGQAMLEAASCGIPIVASNVGGIPEVVRQSQSGLLVPYRKPEAMARAALNILKHPKLARQLGQSARRYINSSLTTSKQAKAFRRLYDRLLA